MEYTRHGNNAALSIHVLDDAAMRALGFTDRVPEDWYLWKPVSDDHTDVAGRHGRQGRLGLAHRRAR